eukprot:8093233-Alexandrium_andersonii.AAC.1
MTPHRANEARSNRSAGLWIARMEGARSPRPTARLSKSRQPLSRRRCSSPPVSYTHLRAHETSAHL